MIPVILGLAMLLAEQAKEQASLFPLEFEQGGIVWRCDPKTEGTARNLAGPAASKLQDLRMWYGAPLNGKAPVIAIAPDEEAFRQLLGSGTPEWYAAATFGGRRTIILRSQRDLATPPEEALATLYHELSHIVLQEAAGPYAHTIPLWFNEGLAQYASGEKTLTMRYHLWVAAISNRLFPLASLEEEFPESETAARQAYEQSYDFVSFLVENYSQRVIRWLFDRLREGRTFQDAFLDVTGLRLSTVEAQWRSESKFGSTFLYALTATGTVWTLLTVLFLWAYLRKRREARDNLILMEAEEELEDHGIPPTYH